MDKILRASIPPHIAVIGDVIAVIVFVVIGRRNHEDGYALPGLLLALLPFLLGLGAGWGLIRWLSNAWPARVLHGITLAVSTAFVGLAVRPLMGQSVGDGFTGLLSFAAVGLAFLLLFIVGWRLVAALVIPASDDERGTPGEV